MGIKNQGKINPGDYIDAESNENLPATNLKCPNCGADITDDMKYCPKCGYKLKKMMKKIEINLLFPLFFYTLCNLIPQIAFTFKVIIILT